ncbi:rho-GTPase-activating protein-like protein [Sporormia fimetaria CBS 119925]|uniref:Rho-GTPase-activating protein-like protein n=1 Tax=Sporormia fimetaria CBS 119925 TaxID=1340428 RepID=A0A6A6VIK5_9PLEO|nr:rho-GTPase-activating protein-like protein [Sporormia fimetaria CBS 119925]
MANSGFASSFWSTDYAGGLGVLFQKLQQGVQENQQILTIARLRADAEDSYGNSLANITPATDRVSGGFQRDEGASVRKAYEGVRTEMEAAAQSHRKIASNIRELVVNPFGRWAEQHAIRVQNSQDDLQARIKLHDRQAEAVRKFRSQYYNKCRLVEDLEEEDKLAFQDPQSEVNQSPKVRVPTIKMSEPDDDDEVFEIGDESYSKDQMKKILTHALESLKLQEVKVPILGTYQNCSTGADITEYIQKHMAATSVSYAERIGQDLISAGFLRLVGNVGNTFANSSRMSYQWKPKVFQLTGVPEKKQGLARSSTVMSQDSFTVDSPVNPVQEYLSGWNPLNNQYPNESPSEKLRREAREADERYKQAVKKLDSLRCNLEEAMIDHLKFMERCELDRLKAIKAVILDFSGAVSNVIPSLQSTVDKMMLFQETIQPLGDVRYLLENYRTGPYVPRVTTYENYYNTVDEQTFGVDLEARARSDRKRVPIIVTTILTFLDNHYPDLEGDEARRGIWLVDVPLAQTHNLRNAINTGKSFNHEILEKYDIPIVASVLKLYLLELPASDSLVSSHVYEIVKTIYSTTATETSEETRISVIQSTLGQLRLANIATLDAISTHFTRLIELTSADEAYVTALANTLAPCILRPRVESSLTMNERYSYRLIRDLFAHKDAIFGELKRASTLTHSASGAQRPRAISTDESNRRANYEERNRAIAARSPRAVSPGPSARNGSHRRDRSQTRFPVNTNTSSPTERRSTAGTRNSLEVPGSETSTPIDGANGAPEEPQAPATPPSTRVLPFGRKHAGSLARSNRDSTSSLKIEESADSPAPAPTHRGVQLEDKPMDD